jgi:hypothetical protein
MKPLQAQPPAAPLLQAHLLQTAPEARRAMPVAADAFAPQFSGKDASKIPVGNPTSAWTDEQINAFLEANAEKYNPQVELLDFSAMAQKANVEIQRVSKTLGEDEETQKPKALTDSMWDVGNTLWPIVKNMSEIQAAETRALELLPTESTWRVFKYRWSLTKISDQLRNVQWKAMAGAVLRLKFADAWASWKSGSDFVARKVISLQGASRIKQTQSKVMKLKEQKPFIEAHLAHLNQLIQDKSIPLTKRLSYRMERKFLCYKPLGTLKTYAPLLDRIPPFPFHEFKQDLDVLSKEYEAKTGRKIEEVEPEPLGTGSIAQVFKAKDSDGNLLAIKVLRPDARPEVIDQFTDYHYYRETIQVGWENRVTAYRNALRKTELLKAELTLSREKENADAFQQIIETFNTQNPEHPIRLNIPPFYASTQRGNVQAFVETPPLSQLESADQLNQALFDISPAMLRILALASIIPLDPHHGNFTQGDAKNQQPPTALDHGRTVTVAPRLAKAFSDLRLLLTMDTRQFEIRAHQASEALKRDTLMHLILNPDQVTSAQLDTVLKALTDRVTLESSQEFDGNLLGSALSGKKKSTSSHEFWWNKKETNIFNFWLRYNDVQEELKANPDGPQLKPLFNLAISPDDKQQVLEKTMGLLQPMFVAPSEGSTDADLLERLQSPEKMAKLLLQSETDPAFHTDLRQFFSPRHTYISEGIASDNENRDLYEALKTKNAQKLYQVLSPFLAKDTEKRRKFLQLCRAHERAQDLSKILVKDVRALYPDLLPNISDVDLSVAFIHQIRDYVGLDAENLIKKKEEEAKRNIFEWIFSSIS